MSSPTVNLLLLSSALLALACCGDDSSSTAADAGSGSDGNTTNPEACSGLNATGPGLSTRTITVSGVERSYELSIPAEYDATKPARLVFGMHGLGGNGALLRAYTDVEGSSLAASGGTASIFAYPDALVVETFGATGWELSDAALFDAIVVELSAELCIDASLIFSYGHSFGGYFSNMLGCLRGNTLRAIAPVAGGLLGGLTTCESAMPAWIAHATNDGTVPVAQGLAARDKWLVENQCSETTEAVAPDPCISYNDCQSGAQVVWCETATGGHNWPGYSNGAIWDFFLGFEAIGS